ncbi:MAG: pitrilysin family protein [Candidatus Kapabacteria bacterium]|nr:pitrilysin family protein [Candidatus Kapabacteria bacterium]
MRKLILYSFIVLSFIMLNFLKSISQINSEILMPSPSDPIISFRIWFKVGSVNDPVGKEGLAALTANLMVDGSTSKNKYEVIVDKLYPMASSYNSKTDKEMTVVYGKTHYDNLEDFYKLFIDAIIHPAFNNDDFIRVKKQYINYIEKNLRYSSDEELAKAVLSNFIFEGTEYSHLASGTVASLNAITLEDVKNFYKTYFNKNNYQIGLAGNFEEKLNEKIKKDLSQLSDGSINGLALSQPKKINGCEYLFVEKNNDATAISFGFPIEILRNSKDFAALWLFNSWFGEHRNQSSHLYQVIREKRGMNYGDYSYIETFLNGGRLEVPQPNNPRHHQIFEVWIRPVKHEHRHFALRAALRELHTVVENGITKSDFEQTQKFLYKYILHYAPTSMIRLGYQIDSRFYGVEDNGDYIEYLRKNIAALTLEDVNNSIKKYIQFENIKFAIVTKDSKKFAKDLIDNTVSPVTYSTPKPIEVLEEDKIIENFKIKTDITKIKIVEVEEMFK